MILRLRILYRSLYELWKNGLKDYFLRTTAAFFLLALVFFGAGLVLPSFQDRLWSMIRTSVESSGAVNENGTVNAMAIFINNTTACAMILLYGLIPFVRLGAIPLGLNAMSIGTTAVFYLANELSFFVFFAALTPHGIIELPALFLALGMSFYTCDQLSRRWKRDEEAHSMRGCCALSFRLYMLVIVPVLAVSAWIESSITPLFISIFS